MSRVEFNGVAFHVGVLVTRNPKLFTVAAIAASILKVPASAGSTGFTGSTRSYVLSRTSPLGHCLSHFRPSTLNSQLSNCNSQIAMKAISTFCPSISGHFVFASRRCCWSAQRTLLIHHGGEVYFK